MINPKSGHQIGQQFTQTICLNIPVVQAHVDDFNPSARCLLWNHGTTQEQSMKCCQMFFLFLLLDVSKSVVDRDGTWP